MQKKQLSLLLSGIFLIPILLPAAAASNMMVFASQPETAPAVTLNASMTQEQMDQALSDLNTAIFSAGDYSHFDAITLDGVNVVIDGDVIMDDFVLNNCIVSGAVPGSVLTVTNTLT